MLLWGVNGYPGRECHMYAQYRTLSLSGERISYHATWDGEPLAPLPPDNHVSPPLGRNRGNAAALRALASRVDPGLHEFVISTHAKSWWSDLDEVSAILAVLELGDHDVALFKEDPLGVLKMADRYTVCAHFLAMPAPLFREAFLDWDPYPPLSKDGFGSDEWFEHLLWCRLNELGMRILPIPFEGPATWGSGTRVFGVGYRTGCVFLSANDDQTRMDTVRDHFSPRYQELIREGWTEAEQKIKERER